MDSMSRYRTDLRHCVPLSATEERELSARFAAGERAAGDRLIEACLPFVISIAREYRRSGVPLEDLVQQGNLGLLQAAARFDPSRECRLATYAARWIRGEIRAYVTRTARIVRLGSTHTERTAVRLFRGGKASSPEQLAEASGMPVARARMLWALLTRPEVALDARRGEGPSALERLEGGALNPEEEIVNAQRTHALREAIAQALPALGERERMILEERWLADDPRTLEDLGRDMGVSRERVRQLEQRARERLRRALEPVMAA